MSVKPNFEVTCPACGKKQYLHLPATGLIAYIAGVPIQRAFPDFSPQAREMVLTGICEDCWNELFKE